MKNLENYGVQELDAKEIQNTDGGIEIIDFLSFALGFAGPGEAAVGLILSLGVGAAGEGTASPNRFIGY